MAAKTLQRVIPGPLLSQGDEQSPPGLRGNAMSVRFAEVWPGAKMVSPSSKGRRFTELAMASPSSVKTPAQYTNEDLTGPFVDYLVRMCASKFNCRLARALLDGTDNAVKDQQYEEALDQVKLERLMASLSIVFTHYYKEHDPENWKAKGTEMKDHVWQIVKYKRQQLALSSEIDNWIQRDKLLRSTFVLPAFEGDEVRQGRLQQFWKRYHASSKLNGIPANFQLEAPMESPPMQTDMSNPSPAAPVKKRESSAPRSLTPGGDAWKQRGSRSFCSRGGSRPGSSQSLTRTGSRNTSANDSLSFPSFSATSMTSSKSDTSQVATRRQAWNGIRSPSKSAASSRAGSKSEDLKSTEEGSHANSSRAVSKSEDGSFLSSSTTLAVEGFHGTPAGSRPSSRSGTLTPAATTLWQPPGEIAHQTPTIKLIGVDSLPSPPPRRPSTSWAEDPKSTLLARSRTQTELTTPSRGGSRASSRPGSKHGRGDTPQGSRLRIGSAPAGDPASSRSTSRPGSKGLLGQTLSSTCRPSLSSKDSSMHGSRSGSKRPPWPPTAEQAARPRFVGSLEHTLSVADLRKWGFDADSTLFSSLASQIPQEPSEAPEPPVEAPPANPQKLRKQRTVMQPYDTAAGAHAVRMAKSGANSYVDACTSRNSLPSLKPFCTGHSSCLSAPGYGLTDNDLLAVVEVLPSIGEVSEMNLEGNSLLTEASLGPLLACLEGTRSKNLKELSLKDCMRKMTVDSIHDVVRTISTMLIEDMQKLKGLNLSGIPMTAKLHLPLCEAIRAHPSLKRVGLAGIKLGIGTDPTAAARCMSLLLANGSLQHLDLGWNTFDEHCFRSIGLGVVSDSTLKSLSLASCSCSCLSPSGGSSVETFIEIIEADRSLTSLDLSNNRIDFRGALVLEASLELNPTLRFLDLQSNPLGSLGLRCLLRLMARSTSGISSLNCEACVAGSSCLLAAGESNPIFSETNPSGRYGLQLDRLYDRALLKMLCRTGHRMGLSPEQAFSDMVSDFGFQYPVRTPDGLWPIPTAGKVSLTFSIRNALEIIAKSKDLCFQVVLDRIFQMTRLSIPFEKQVPILALWKKLAGQTAEQGIVLEGLAKDFHITVPMFTQLCEDKAESSSIAERLFANMVGGQSVRFLAGLCVQTLTDYLKLMKVCRRLLLFNVENPTGHYRLDLANWCDHAVAEQLLVLDRWECTLADKAGLVVVSQGAVRTSLRNALHEDRQLSADAIAEFSLPEYGNFSLDYSSLQKPPLGAKALTQEPFRKVLLTLQRSDASPLHRVKTVTMTSHFWYLDCLQLRALTGIFESPAIRAETFARLATRIVDPHNEKVFRSRFADQQEFQTLLNRLGHVFYFPFIQPEQTCFRFHLSDSEQRGALNLLIRLSKEENKDNIRDAILKKIDGSVDELLVGLPESWQTFENISRSGTLTLRYECSPDDRNYEFRASLLETYGYVQPPLEHEVLWWSSITTCPPDVVEFVEFLNASFESLTDAFEALIGTSDAVSLQDFEDGVLTNMRCRKFNGPQERERVRDVFRYLDPSGEGLISHNEWRVLDQIFKEVQLCIKEFVQFCERTFGISWPKIWNAIDVDGSGEINAEEWKDICKSYGFFGPSRPIFAFLDMDDTGSISAKEFDLLKQYSDSLGAARSSRRRYTVL